MFTLHMIELKFLIVVNHKLLQHSAAALVTLVKASEVNNFDPYQHKRGLNPTFFFLKEDKGEWTIIVDTINKAFKSKKALYCAYFMIEGGYSHVSKAHLQMVIDNELEALTGNKTIYFDIYESQGMDFSYCQPFKTFIYQPFLKNKHLSNRRQFTESSGISLHFKDVLNDALFENVQKIAVSNYGVKTDKILKAIPVKLYNGELLFSNSISINEETNGYNEYSLKMHEETSWLYSRRCKIYDICTMSDAHLILTKYDFFINKIRSKLFIP